MLNKNLNLVKELTLSDFKLKYKGSILGFFWSLLKPLMLFAILYFVFSRLIKLDVVNYELFLLLGIILWTFLQDGTMTGMNSLLANRDLVRKLHFRKEILVLSNCLSSFLSLLLNMVVFFIFMFIFKGSLTFKAFYFIIILIEIFILVLGLSFGLSALYSKYRDLRHIWEVILLLGFWMTPIVYPFGIIPNQYLKFYILNPMTRLIYTARNIFIFDSIESFKHLLITFIICYFFLIIGYWIFKKRSDKLAEEI